MSRPTRLSSWSSSLPITSSRRSSTSWTSWLRGPKSWPTMSSAEKLNEPSVIDVSLMSVGAWATALSITTALLLGEPTPPPPLTAPPYLPVNPTLGTFRTSDGRFITLMMLQPGRYFADTCRHLGIEHLLDDERFQTAEGLMANAEEVGKHVADAIAQQSYAEWVEQLETLEGPWSPAQNPLEIVADPQLEANGYLLPSSMPRGTSERWSRTRCSSTRHRRADPRRRSSPSTPTTSCASSARARTRSSSSRSTAPAPDVEHAERGDLRPLRQERDRHRHQRRDREPARSDARARRCACRCDRPSNDGARRRGFVDGSSAADQRRSCRS